MATPDKLPACLAALRPPDATPAASAGTGSSTVAIIGATDNAAPVPNAIIAARTTGHGTRSASAAATEAVADEFATAGPSAR